MTIGRLLKALIDAYALTEEALTLAHGVTDDGSVNTNRGPGGRRGRHGRWPARMWIVVLYKMEGILWILFHFITILRPSLVTILTID